LTALNRHVKGPQGPWPDLVHEDVAIVWHRLCVSRDDTLTNPANHIQTPMQALELVRALAAHCPSVAEAAALWGGAGLPAILAHLRRGHDAGLREAAAAALDAVLRLHKAPAVREVLAKGLRIRGLIEAYGARPFVVTVSVGVSVCQGVPLSSAEYVLGLRRWIKRSSRGHEGLRVCGRKNCVRHCASRSRIQRKGIHHMALS